MSAGQGDGLAVVVLGASGDLALRKVMPALFALDARGLLPAGTHFFGFARSFMTDDEFRGRLAPRLRCDDLAPDVCALGEDGFLRRCHYQPGDYGDARSFAALDRRLETLPVPVGKRIYYFAVPPQLFETAAGALREAGSLESNGADAWTRVVIEKPFGHDRESSDRLTARLRRVFEEKQLYRIDHYLGKEVIQNLMVLRFANRVFEPVWNRDHVRHVHIAWAEDVSLRGRAGYFDRYGIVRDVMQNHLTQILALTAMECPETLHADHVRDEKVRLLRQVAPLTRERVVLGQYVAGRYRDRDVPGYRQEPGVPSGSTTATYAAAVFDLDAPRWRGVPFMISAGKGLCRHHTEVRVQFKPPAQDLFRSRSSPALSVAPLPPDNELVIRVQPDEKIALRIVGKVPGPGMRLDTPLLDLRYRDTFHGLRIGDAYESLLLDVVRGERSLFLRDDELEASWDIFTPLLHEIDKAGAAPFLYPFGSGGPRERVALAARFGIEDPD